MYDTKASERLVKVHVLTGYGCLNEITTVKTDIINETQIRWYRAIHEFAPYIASGNVGLFLF